MALFSDNQRATIPKEYLKEGSPIFTYKVASIAATASKDYDFQTDTTYAIVPAWLPFDFMQIQNNSGVDMSISINQDPNNTVYIPQGTIVKVTDLPIRSIRITNQNATTASTVNLLQIVLQKLPPDTNSFIRKIIKITGVI